MCGMWRSPSAGFFIPATLAHCGGTFSCCGWYVMAVNLEYWWLWGGALSDGWLVGSGGGGHHPQWRRCWASCAPDPWWGGVGVGVFFREAPRGSSSTGNHVSASHPDTVRLGVRHDFCSCSLVSCFSLLRLSRRQWDQLPQPRTSPPAPLWSFP